MMKRLILISIAGTLTLSAMAEQTIRTQLEVRNKRNEAALKVYTPTAQTANMLEVYKGTVLTFAVPATGVLGTAYGGTGGATPAASRASLGIKEWTTNTILTAAAGGTGSDDIGTGLANIGLRSGTVLVSADGTVTNTWGTVFGRAPVVVLTPKAAVPQGSNFVYVVSCTVSNMIVFGHTNTTYNWIAAQPAQ